MKAATLRSFLSVHTWVGLIAGMALFIAFYAGSITVFTHELGDWQRPADTQPAQDPIGRSQALLDALLNEHPESAHGVFLVLPGDHGPQPSAYWYIEETARYRRFVLDAADALQEIPERIGFVEFLYDLHFGNFGQYAVKWLYFVLGLAGAFLFYSGNLLWIEARRKRRQVDQPRRTRVMAALTLGVCLGCVAGVSAAFIAGALLPEVWVPRIYFVAFFSSLAWTAWRPPARAGHELLWLCALLTAVIPLASWIGSGEHLFAAFAHGHWHRFFVDTIALALAAVYWRMARATLRRGLKGDPNSVWALH